MATVKANRQVKRLFGLKSGNMLSVVLLILFKTNTHTHTIKK